MAETCVRVGSLTEQRKCRMGVDTFKLTPVRNRESLEILELKKELMKQCFHYF